MDTGHCEAPGKLDEGSPDYDLINDSTKSAVIDHEQAKRLVDIAALQETRILEKGSINLSAQYTGQGNQLAPNVNTALDLP